MEIYLLEIFGAHLREHLRAECAGRDMRTGQISEGGRRRPGPGPSTAPLGQAAKPGPSIAPLPIAADRFNFNAQSSVGARVTLVCNQAGIG